MNNIFQKKKIFGALIFIAYTLLATPFIARAATFTLSLDKQAFPVGSEFTADVKMDTEGVGINASQGTISFSPDVLSVLKIDRTNSVFNFWLQEPSFTNSTGRVTFLGGSTSGFAGTSLEVFRVTFKVKGIGKSDITFIDGAITASDGSGTNVMKGTTGVQITSASQSNIIAITPSQITRQATIASGLPSKPKFSIKVYPTSTGWSSISTRFNVEFVLPGDITDISTLISKNPTDTTIKSEGLFDNKSFDALTDGIWYLHAQYKNNVGWGPAEHYKISIDTAPPIPFEIKADFGNSVTNPSPILTFESADQLSGINKYEITIDGKEVGYTTSTSFTVPAQTPGKHQVKVSALDIAGNITENYLDIKIVPLDSPTLSLANRDIYTNESGLSFRGTTQPDKNVKIEVKNTASGISFEKTAHADPFGIYDILIDNLLPRGTYSVIATTIDDRGALSMPAKPLMISVKDRPLAILFGIPVTQMALIWTLLTTLILSFLLGFFYNKKSIRRRENQIIIANRDVVHAFGMVKNEITSAMEVFNAKKMNSDDIANIEFSLKKMVSSLDKTEKYITENISEIED